MCFLTPWVDHRFGRVQELSCHPPLWRPGLVSLRWCLRLVSLCQWTQVRSSSLLGGIMWHGLSPALHRSPQWTVVHGEKTRWKFCKNDWNFKKKLSAITQIKRGFCRCMLADPSRGKVRVLTGSGYNAKNIFKRRLETCTFELNCVWVLHLLI